MASQVDKDGWTALMHAANFLVYWSHAVPTVRGLIEKMSAADVNLAATGGRCIGYTALHLVCQNSDRMKKKAELTELLLRRGAKVDARTPTGSTPFLFAAGTGVVDVAQVLVSIGDCDIRAETSGQPGKPRRNAAGMCWGVFYQHGEVPCDI